MASGTTYKAALPSALSLALAAALLCAAVSVMGPVAFVGLAAPHIAALIGARTAKAQLAAASLSGAAIVGWSDWLGQVLIAPAQLPVGTLAALFGAAYFLALLLWRRLGRKGALH